MTAEIFFDFINKYGFPIAFLWYAVKTWITPMINNLQARNAVLEARHSEDGESRHLSEIISIENAIVEILAQASQKFGAQWVMLWQLHNGTVSIDGIPFIKMSVTHEYAAIGCMPRLSRYQNVPISVFARELKTLNAEKVLRVDKSNEFFPAVANSYIRDGVENGIFVCVGTHRGDVAGVFSVGWNEPHDSTPEAIEIEMKGFAARVSILLAQLASYRYMPLRRAEDGKVA